MADDQRGAGRRVPGEVFFSYPRRDRDQVMPLVQALKAAGVTVFLDEKGIDEFEGITPFIRHALSGARLFLAYYSVTYPTRPACQWELLTAFRAATALGPPSRRILVVNPEASPDHIQPVELRDPRYLDPAADQAVERLVQLVQKRLTESPGPLGDAIQAERPVWRPTEHIGSERFVGRVESFWELHTALHAHEYPATHHGASAAQVAVIGLGGIGKTLLAEHYARRFSSFYPGGVYWFTAAASHAPDTTMPTTNDPRPKVDIDALHAEVQAQHHQQIAAALALDHAQHTPEQIREAARHHIEKAGKPCLWIVDDLPGHLTPEVLRELAAPHPLGHTVFTTRWRGYPLPTIDLDVLTPDEAHHLLTHVRPPADPAEQQAAQALIVKLGGHALALDLARGCLEDQPNLTYTTLLAELADTQHGDAFQQLLDDLYLQVPTGHTADIAATFTRSLRHLDPDALTLLRTAATLAPVPIPTRLLTTATATLTTHTAGQDDLDEAAAERANRRALSAAQRRSLIRQTGTQPPAWFLHALVSRTLTLDPNSRDIQPAIREAATSATTRLMQPVYTPGRLDLADLTPHARALTETLDTPASLALLDALARHDLETGQPASAAICHHRVLQAREATLGTDHPDTLAARNGLASAYQQAGDLGRAVPLHEQTLADCERVLGPDHPDTLTNRSNLAYAYLDAGDLGRAIPLHEQALADRERVMGPDHPDTLTSRNNLALAYQEAKDLGRAIPLMERTLADCERVLRPDHPDTLGSRHNLAFVYLEAEDLGRAIPLLERTLADCERVLGPDHPNTLTTRDNLATAYHDAEDLGRAVPLFEQVLSDRERVMGPDHPYTLTSRSNLASAYQRAGDLGRAIPLHERTLADRERVLGPDHPNTLASRNKLAGAYRDAKHLGRAIPLFEQALVDRERVLGPDHPDTLASRSNLASAYLDAEDLGRAVPLFEQVLVDRERVLGPDHPDTLASRSNLAGAYRSAGDLGRAIPLLEQTLAKQERVLESDHPDTTATRDSLALSRRLSENE
ncbi:tetratricopeptide repeat protein [Streptomyces collinus]|uniref:tetratricopeptide repeat protein n=1 Tax=Streptomyces collinus TaxID=42684 RepID=UPI003698F7AA